LAEWYCFAVVLPFGQFMGEYNTTSAKAEISLCRKAQYHSDEVGISLEKGLVYAILDSEVILMSESPLRDKAKEFAKNIVVLCREIKAQHKETVLTNQLLRSGTSIGANLHEARYAQGTKDFISKLEIAQKECFETEYWLELLFDTGYIVKEKYLALKNDCGALRRMLISSLQTIKSK